MADYREIMLDGLCRLLAPRHIILAGGRDGDLARVMLEAARLAGATLHIVAEHPGDRLRGLRQDGGDACIIHAASIEAALSILPVPALIWVDGDPNWHSVQAAMAAIETQAARLGKSFPVTIIEGAGWPHGRRDGYDDPAAIPEAFRHPHERAGLLPGQAMPAGGGGLHADVYHATAENEPRNGVLTAVEDFMEGRTAVLRSVVLPGFGGRVAVTPRTGIGAEAFAPASLTGILHAIAQALDAVRLEHAVALAGAQAEVIRAKTVVALLREAASSVPEAAWRARLRPAVHLARRLVRGQPAGGAAAGRVPAMPEPAWRTQLRPAVHLARRLVAGRPSGDEAAQQEETRQANRLRASPIFDGGWYLQRYTDVAAAGMDPVEHYLRSGAAEMRDPGPFFSSGAYLRAHPDVAEAGLNPLLHYLVSGADEGRQPGGEFDLEAYLTAHPGARLTRVNPLEHHIASLAVSPDGAGLA